MATDMFEIIPELEALELHFRNPLTGEARNRWLIDWTRDLAGFSIEAIRDACKHWRMNGEKFPKPGEFIRVLRNQTKHHGETENPAWAPLSQEEFEALDLPGKIRHHRIMAHEARLKAGPMFRNSGVTAKVPKMKDGASGQHLTPEEMSDDWHHWTKRAEEHEAEAKLLTHKLKGTTPMGLMPLPAYVAPSMTPQELAQRIRNLDTVPFDDVGVVL